MTVHYRTCLTVICIALSLLPIAVSASIKATAEQIKTARQVVAEKQIKVAKRPLKPEYAADRIVVKLRPGKDSKLQSLTASVGGKIRMKIGKSDYYSVKLPKDADLDKILAKFRSNPNVEYAGRDQILRVALEPNDPVYYYGDDLNMIAQWGLNNTTGTPGADIHAVQAWNITTGSPDVVVAVIDTGVDLIHPDLEDKIWQNPGEIGYNGLDDDQNGFIDDWRGWNFAYDNNDPQDDFTYDGLPMYHGTMVAGIIAASTNNYDGMAGVSWGSPILAIKAANADGAAYCSDLAASIDYAVSLGVKIINISMAGKIADPTDPDSINEPLVRAAVDRAWAAGALCVCASGNENTDALMFPASYEHAISVGASNENDARCSSTDWGPGGGSNWGPSLDVMSPGNMIVSTSRCWSDFFAEFEIEVSPYDTQNGTSFACPHVAGVVALLWSKYPNMTLSQVVEQIKKTTDDINTPGFDIYTGWGRVNAYRALTEFPVSLSSASGVKTNPIGTFVSLPGMIVTATNDQLENKIYVQDADRTAGTLCWFTTPPSGTFDIGDEVTVTGKTEKLSGEVGIKNPTLTITTEATQSTMPPQPLGMMNRSVGGGIFGQQGRVVNHYPATRTFAVGQNNIGLLVKIWGKVTAAGSDFIYIDDGSGLKDDTGNLGVRVVFDPDDIAPYWPPQKVAVTGVSSCELVSGSTTILRRIIRPRTQEDLKLLHN